CLRQAGEVLDQHVAVGEQSEQDELERLPLADDRALDLVEEAVRPLGDLENLHSFSTTATTSAMRSSGRTGASWLRGRARSARTKSQTSGPRSASADPLGASRSMPRSRSLAAATLRIVGRSR